MSSSVERRGRPTPAATARPRAAFMTSALDQTELARALFDELGDALFLLDPDSDRLLEANPVALRLTGFTRAELLALPATDLFRFEAAGGVRRLQAAFAKTMVFHGQDGYLLRTKGAAWVPVSLTASRMHVSPRPLGLIIARDDRDRRAAFAQARKVEGELRKVLASSPAALWSAERRPGPDVQLGWQFRYVSPLLARLAGRSPESIDHPFRWIECVHPADRDGYRSTVRRLLTTVDPDAEQVYRVLAPGGAVRWVRDRLQVVRDDAGRPARLDGCVTDVTAQYEAEEALRQSEQRFRALVEKSHDAILLIDDRGRVRYASPAVAAASGRDPLALVGSDGFQLLHPDDRGSAHKLLVRALARPGEVIHWTCRGRRPDGSVPVIELSGCNRLDDPSVRAVVVNYRDVTEREHQHALVRGLFDSLPDVVVHKDRDLRFVDGNRAFEELAGRPVADLVGKACEEVFRGQGWAERLLAAEREVIATGKTLPGRDRVTYPDGREALLDILFAPYGGAGGEVAGLLTIGRDLTQQARLEEHVRQVQKMEAVGQLAGGIAHDFNNLLTVILGNLELVRTGRSDPGDRAELLDTAEKAARQAADLTRQLLGFARQQPPRVAPLDLSALVREQAGLLRRTLLGPGLTVHVRAGEGLPQVAADPVQVQQVVMNLCLNARDAMPAGGTLVVETTATTGAAARLPAGCYARLSVSDTGVGMTEDVKARIFEPFYTTKELGKGTGLGLATVYGIVRAHGGSIECVSQPGEGTRFDVYLPCSTPSAEKPALGQTVLVADDDPVVRELARLGLEAEGYRVVTAGDGAEAVAVFEREAGRVRLVVLDSSMPVVCGRQALEAIRAADPDVRVLLASGGPFEPDVGGAGIGRLMKPYGPAELAGAVRALLDG